MPFRKEKMLLDNKKAVVGQPIGLLIILIIAAIIMTLLSFSIQNLLEDSQIHQVEREINTILTDASNMYEYATEGSTDTLHVEFPMSLRFIVFGTLPRNGILEPTDLSLDENTTNNYYFVMNDGTLKIFHSNARFSSRNLTQIALFHSGAYDITLELCSKEGKSYVTMYSR
jgi:hypothetical protein